MRKWRSLIALIIVLTLIIGMLTTVVFSIKAYGDGDVSSMQSDLDDLIAKRERLEKELKAIANKKDAALEQKDLLDQQINSLNDEVAILNTMVDDLSDQLDESEEKLAAAESVLDEQTVLAKQRVRAMYELGSTSYAEIILSSKSLHDFVTRIELVKQMASYDQKVIEELKTTKETIQSETEKIKSNKETQQKALNTLENNVSSLEKKKDQSENLIETFNKKTEANLKAIEEAEKAEAQLQAEIRQALSSSKNESFVGGQFQWPVSGYYTISDVFGYRTHPITGVYKMHTGVDICGSGIRNKPILAANSGTVLKAGYNRAYGNYVVIDHGGGYTTLYGHANSLNVSAGQTVSRGDTIAYVGSTGYSTGPHLHFEVMQNGNYINPLSYFSYNFIYT